MEASDTDYRETYLFFLLNNIKSLNKYTWTLCLLGFPLPNGSLLEVSVAIRVNSPCFTKCREAEINGISYK